MAGRFGRSLYRFSSVNRPLAPAASASARDSDAPQYPYSAARNTSHEPRPRSPTRRSLPASPTYSVKKPASPPSSPPYRAPAVRTFGSPPKPVDEYPNYKPTTHPRSPEAEQKALIYKAKPVGKTASSSQKQQPNEININGENVGAVMEIVESKKREGGHIIKNQKADGGKKSTSSPPAPPTTNFLNSNFQSVNNSLLYNASLAHRDPGLHLDFSRNPTADRFALDKQDRDVMEK